MYKRVSKHFLNMSIFKVSYIFVRKKEDQAISRRNPTYNFQLKVKPKQQN